MKLKNWGNIFVFKIQYWIIYKLVSNFNQKYIFFPGSCKIWAGFSWEMLYYRFLITVTVISSSLSIWIFLELLIPILFRSEAFNESNLDHEMLLLQLWTLLQPDTPLLKRVTKQWQSIGNHNNILTFILSTLVTKSSLVLNFHPLELQTNIISLPFNSLSIAILLFSWYHE